jgi:hypothetical protein
MRHRIVERGGRALGVGLLGTLAVMATTVVTGFTPAGGAVSTATPWSAMKAPVLAGFQTQDSLVSVSCPAVKLCVAVGSQITEDETQSQPRPLTEVWRGASWSQTSAPNPDPGKNGGAGFSSVSCSLPTYCMAVGSSNTGGFAELWNGHSWSAPKPIANYLGSVSCVATEPRRRHPGGRAREHRRILERRNVDPQHHRSVIVGEFSHGPVLRSDCAVPGGGQLVRPSEWGGHDRRLLQRILVQRPPTEPQSGQRTQWSRLREHDARHLHGGRRGCRQSSRRLVRLFHPDVDGHDTGNAGHRLQRRFLSESGLLRGRGEKRADHFGRPLGRSVERHQLDADGYERSVRNEQ